MGTGNTDADLEIIAEAGSNHNGDAALARRLVEAAAAAGADSVKFQLIDPASLYLPAYRQGDELVPNAVFEQRSKELLDDATWRELAGFTKGQGIAFSASAFDRKGVEFLVEIGAPYLKIASTDSNHVPLLEIAAEAGVPTIVSTGMSTLADVERVVDLFQARGDITRLTLLHCVSAYPCPLEESRLFMIPVLRSAFGVRIGYSDHTLGSEAALMAVALGATVIEKHFTVDKSLPGFDHAHAMDADELRDFCTLLRQAKSACTRSASKLTDKERVTSVRARRGLYAARDLEAGHVLTEADVLVVRPSAELEPADLGAVIGETVGEPIRQYDPIGRPRGLGVGRSRWREADSYWKNEMSDKGMAKG